MRSLVLFIALWVSTPALAGDDPVTTDSVEAPPVEALPPQPIEDVDREGLVTLAQSLPRHGVLVPKIPALTADDETWRRFARKLLEVFAPQSLSRDAKAKLVAQARPVTIAIDALIPRHRRYVALQQRLEAYAADHGAPAVQIPDTRYKIRAGSTAPEIGLLRDRLRLEGYGDPNVVGKLRDYWDDRLKRALHAWQKDHGLPPTVVLDDLTRKRLNEPVTAPIADVALALARWRDLDLRADRGLQIFIDMTSFQLVAERDGAPELTMPVVVGKATEEDATPSRTAPLLAVIVNPWWVVPARIVEELKPGAGYMPEQLIDKGYEVTVDAGGKWKVKMPPGPENPLGKLKFTLEGTNGVYLHDTSARHLFGKADRTLSHGCVRLSQPDALARLLMPDRPFDLENALALPTLTQVFNMREPVPVHFVYQTIAVPADAGDRLERRNDIYARDVEELAAFDGPAIAAALRALVN